MPATLTYPGVYIEEIPAACAGAAKCRYPLTKVSKKKEQNHGPN